MVQFTVINTFKDIRQKYKVLPKVPAAVWQNPVYFFGFGLGSGAMPFAPGTFGTLMAIPVYLLFSGLPLSLYLAFIVIVVVLASMICQKLSQEINVHDHPGMCLDEFPGFFVTMIGAPPTFTWILLGFLLFRIFDILKPWPINVVDKKITNGFGMVLDDVLAGVYAFFIMQILLRIFG